LTGSESISTGGGTGDAISEDHYFAKNTELRVWLLETKKARFPSIALTLTPMTVVCARVSCVSCLAHVVSSISSFFCLTRVTLQIYFDDLNADEGRTWFKQFVVAWNTGKLASKFYKGMDHSQQSAAERTKFKWGFAKKMSEDDVDKLSSARDSVDTQTFHQVISRGGESHSNAWWWCARCRDVHEWRSWNASQRVFVRERERERERKKESV
jgi:hypothetical protein